MCFFVFLYINFNMFKIIFFLNGSFFFGVKINDKDMILIKLFIIIESVWLYIVILLK